MLRALATARSAARGLLDLARARVGDDVPSTPEVLSGVPAEAVTHRAAELGADLIVVGSHRRGRLDRLLVGSVSEGIVRRATSPVIVVPASRGIGAAGRATWGEGARSHGAAAA